MLCAIFWISEFLLWRSVFEKNDQDFYMGAVVATFILSAIMHFLGMNVTRKFYRQTRTDFLINLGVPGFDMIQIVLVALAYMVFRIF